MEHVFDELPGVVSVTVGLRRRHSRRSRVTNRWRWASPDMPSRSRWSTTREDSVRTAPRRVLAQHRSDQRRGTVSATRVAVPSIIFVADDAQKAAAERSKTTLEQSGRFKRVLTKIEPATDFWPAEAYHQHYYKTHAAAYQMYRVGCGRDARLRQLWGQGQ
jgi:hypothetical protein